MLDTGNVELQKLVMKPQMKSKVAKREQKFHRDRWRAKIPQGQRGLTVTGGEGGGGIRYNFSGFIQREGQNIWITGPWTTPPPPLPSWTRSIQNVDQVHG